MPVPTYARHEVRDEKPNKYDAQSMQDRVAEWINKLKSEVPFLDGNYVTTSAGSTTLPLTTAATDYAHKLGRRWRGYIVLRQDAAQVIFATRVSTAADATFIRLDAGGTVNAEIWVF